MLQDYSPHAKALGNHAIIMQKDDMTFMLFDWNCVVTCMLTMYQIAGALECVISNDEVQLYCSTISTNREEDEASGELLKSIVEHWVTIRGFHSQVLSWRSTSRHT